MTRQREKAAAFRALHERDRAFILPNPWDVGTARLLAGLGFEALATTSAGYATSIGVRDNAVGRERMLAHVAEIVQATDLPVSGDLEDGFGESPETVAETIRLAAEAGLVGGSIEDSRNGVSGKPVFDLEAATERVRAAAETARSLPFPFTLTARAENFIVGRPDLGDTLVRLQAFQEAGADVLYAPGLTRVDQIRAVVEAVDRPVNVLMGIPGVGLTLAQLSELGVRRISLGSALARAAQWAFLRAAREMQVAATFGFTGEMASAREVNELLSRASDPAV